MTIEKNREIPPEEYADLRKALTMIRDQTEFFAKVLLHPEPKNSKQ